MKKLLILLALFGAKILSAQITNPAPYCALNYTFGSSSPTISNVVISSFSNPTGHCAQPGYIYYNNLSPSNMIAGSSQTITITLANYDAETALKGWIDFNGNSLFEPAEQIIYVAQGSVGMSSSITKFANFTVPLSTIIGITRMRIAIGWTFSDFPNSIFQLDSCHTAASEYSAGETEDYDISIISTNGIEEFLSHEISIFPNPTNELLNVELQLGNAQEVEINLLDMLGQTVYASKNNFAVGRSTVILNTASLTRGIYLLQVKTENGKLIRKVQLQ